VRNRDGLVPILETVIGGRDSRDWIAALEAASVPCGPINTLPEVFADPQVRHRGMAVTMAHPLAGDVTVAANPIRMSASPVAYDRPAPMLGQDTQEVMADMLGLPPDEIDRLRGLKII